MTVEALSGEYVLGLGGGMRQDWTFCRSRSRLNCPAVRKPLSLNRRRRD
ncbi:MAG: hypothetical protein ACLSIR_11075 [Christensenellales bacterium]